MSHQDFDKNYSDGYKQGLQTDSGMSLFSPLVIGAVAVMVALAAFLMFSGSDTNQQAEFNTNPPATSTPAPKETSPSVVPSTPPASEQPKAPAQ